MTEEFALTPTDLMRQASYTADTYLGEAIKSIDGRLGAGYACNHPELIGAFMQAAALDYQASFLHNALQAIATSIDEHNHGSELYDTIYAAAEQIAEGLKAIAVEVKEK
jgi:hypothetical protein